MTPVPTDPSSLAELVADLTRHLMSRPAPPTGPPACYLFVITGDGGGTFHLIVDRGYARVVIGHPRQPVDCTIEMSGRDATALVSGRLNAVMAYMTGKVKIRGDMTAAGRLGELLR